MGVTVCIGAFDYQRSVSALHCRRYNDLKNLLELKYCVGPEEACPPKQN